ncbi:hypothetical protein WDU94_008839 [Cyamophila willieti]
MKSSLVLVVILSVIFTVNALYMDVENIHHRKPRAAKDKTEENDEPLNGTPNTVEDNGEEFNTTSNTNYEDQTNTMTSEETKNEMEGKKGISNDIPLDDATNNTETKGEIAGNNELLNTPNITNNAISNDDVPYNDEPKVLPKTMEKENVESLNTKTKENDKITPNITPSEDEKDSQTEENNQLSDTLISNAKGTNNNMPNTKENDIGKSVDTSSKNNKPMSDAKLTKIATGTYPNDYRVKKEQEQHFSNNSIETTSKANDEVDKKTTSNEDVKDLPNSTENEIYISIGIKTKMNANIHTKIVSGNDMQNIENEVDKASEITNGENDNVQFKSNIVKDLYNTKDNVIDLSIGLSSKVNPKVHMKSVSNEQTKEFSKTKENENIRVVEIATRAIDKLHKQVAPNKRITINEANDIIDRKLISNEKSKGLPITMGDEIQKVIEVSAKPTVEAISQGIVETTSRTTEEYVEETTANGESKDKKDKEFVKQIDKLNITVEKLSNMDDFGKPRHNDVGKLRRLFKNGTKLVGTLFVYILDRRTDQLVGERPGG